MNFWVRCGCWMALLTTLLCALQTGSQAAKPIRVVVWDEQQPAQKTAYENFLGNQIADYLRKCETKKGQPDFTVRSVRLDDPEQGLSKETLDNCDVLIYWGHQRHDDLKPEAAKEIARRVKAGQLSLLALHSAHWSRPFVETMNERAIQDAMKTLTPTQRKNVKITTIPAERRLVSRTESLTPFSIQNTSPDGSVTLEVHLPYCVFPAVRADGKPSHIHTLLKKHPIAKGVPENFDIAQTEMYDEPFHVPTPDAVVFEEKWDGGEHFRSGCVWNVGAGKVFYFRPGHETFPIFKDPTILKILENATRYLGSHSKG